MVAAAFVDATVLQIEACREMRSSVPKQVGHKKKYGFAAIKAEVHYALFAGTERSGKAATSSDDGVLPFTWTHKVPANTETGPLMPPLHFRIDLLTCVLQTSTSLQLR